MDNVKTSMLDSMDITELAGLPPGILADLQWLIADEMIAVKRREANLYKAIEHRYADKAAAVRARENKQTGVIHLTDGDHDVTINAPKKVSWDQDKLKAALDAMPVDEARHYAKIAVAIEEKKYEAAPPAIQKALHEARTLGVGKVTYAISAKETAPCV